MFLLISCLCFLVSLYLNGLGCLSANVFSSYTDFLISAVVEFKGPDIFGVVHLAQVNMELTRIEASVSGLTAGKHGWCINEYGDLTIGAASTGKVFNPTNEGPDKEVSSNYFILWNLLISKLLSY